jgi:hypothetical protein
VPQEGEQRGVLAELQEIPAHDDVEAGGRPALVIEGRDAPAEVLRHRRAIVLEDGRLARRVAADAGLAHHHEVLGGGVADAVVIDEGRRIPLAQTGLVDDVVTRRGVPPEVDEAQRLAGGLTRAQLLQTMVRRHRPPPGRSVPRRRRRRQRVGPWFAPSIGGAFPGTSFVIRSLLINNV